MKETIKNSQIEELYLRKYLKENNKGKHSWRHYALIKTDKGKWIWANDYLNKKWHFEKGKNKGKSFIYDYCRAEKPHELKSNLEDND